MGQPQPLAAAVAEILREGDTLEAHGRLWRNAGLKRFLVTQAAALGFLSASVEVNQEVGALHRASLLSNVVSYPAVALAATVIAGGAYAFYRHGERRRVLLAEGRQETVRELLGEPVDVIRDMSGEEPTPVIRWYGLESSRSEPTALFTARRLTRLLDVTAESGVEHFVFSSRALAKFVNVGTGDFGSPVRDTDFYSTSKVEVRNLLADPDLIVATRDQCRSILAGLRQQVGGDVLSHLATVIREGDRRSGIPAAMNRIDPAAGAGLLELRTIASREVIAGAGEATETVRYQDEFGRHHTARVQSTPTIVGDRIQYARTFQDESGVTRDAGRESRSLLSTTGHASLESLIGALVQDGATPNLRTPRARAEAAKAALLITVQGLIRERRRLVSVHPDQGRPPRGSAAVITPLSSNSPGTTLFQQLVNEPPRTRPRLRTVGKVSGGSEPTLEYRRLEGRRIRLSAVGARVLAAATIMVGSSILPNAQRLVAKYYGNRHAQAVADYEIAGEYSLDDYMSDVAIPPAKAFVAGRELLVSLRGIVDDAALWAVRQAGFRRRPSARSIPG